MLGEFFSQPLLDGKPKLQLVVDNSKTAPERRNRRRARSL
jgi:hypothetical protein